MAVYRSAGEIITWKHTIICNDLFSFCFSAMIAHDTATQMTNSEPMIEPLITHSVLSFWVCDEFESEISIVVDGKKVT